MKKPSLATTVGGIRSPNPFWLASAPPTNTGDQIRRAFKAGWGGAVWKTFDFEPIVNVSSRYGAVDYDGRKIMGFNNIELISDRTLEDNLREIKEIKTEFPDHAVVVSLMVESRRERWHEMVQRVEETGCDGLELNFGCPHGMSERGMGSAVGQVPEYTEMITSWVKEVAKTPVIVKLTPNVTDIRPIGRAAKRGGADGISLINTINSIMGIDLDTLRPKPHVAGRGSHGGYCGPAVKPIALQMVHALASDAEINLPVSGIGGIQAWHDAVEFLLLGCSGVQICTAVMHYGFRLVEHMISGLEMWMMEKGFTKLDDFIGRSVPHIGGWGDLDLGYKVTAEIDQNQCIHCGLCYVACEDGAHQSILRERVSVEDFIGARAGIPDRVEISGGRRTMAGAGDGYLNLFKIHQETCVGCNLCALACPVEGCITMMERASNLPSMTWSQYQEKLSKKEIDPIRPHRSE
ncbi:MAG: NAD-dependent dihydropyrimidine dehydrogenase subunit PreA [Candidatus Eisenbacteria bacterium]|uniref:dihydrouracil dehydrogenase (NAD(+)) n=1 Tax=Eiseniibacteriota bacterium TaxID=2212470 RepID=A0A948WCY9_UNCEI|nr:NAD-dependent dihydropyrimidine dehydrogenase subunit PreA [Candidatus Eisenbacteria bacterium]MBU1951228.1 NAD-dependent dihydropyrimidine dehydrogenase subunit PreA [Candidatus Eisenbacteria bacterium]MBU2691343.1 NAD-dependent dihydropyrimidine dehydrogenase subunit PreA [Candidatus Eisenbacteria bacterium]